MDETAAEAERDREIWRRPPHPRPTTQEIDSESLSSALATAHDALGWRDFDLAQRAVDSARMIAPDDPGVMALGIWIEGIRRKKPTADQLDAMRRLANERPAAIMPTVLLIRMLLVAGDVDGADEIARPLDSSVNLPSAQVARAQLLVAKGDTRAGLQILRQLRKQWPARTFGLLTYEMVLAASIADQEAFRDAYTERCRLEGRNAWPWLPWLWGRRLRVLTAVPVIIWGIGVILNLAWLWITAAVLFLGYTIIHWHTLRSRSLTLRTLLVWLGLVAVGLGISAVYSLFG